MQKKMWDKVEITDTDGDTVILTDAGETATLDMLVCIRIGIMTATVTEIQLRDALSKLKEVEPV